MARENGDFRVKSVSETFANADILIVGGAGFVGSNLTKYLLAETDVNQITIIDNFLSSDPENLPNDSRVRVIEGSASEALTLNKISEDTNFIFQLACFHGNQSSIANPLLDLQNNLLPNLMVYDRAKTLGKLEKVVYSAAGCAVAEKTNSAPRATTEDAPVSMFHDSPYSISKIGGELYGNYFFQAFHLPFVKARFQNVYGPGEVLGAGKWRGTPHTIWRNVIPSFVWKALNGEDLLLENHGRNTRDFIYVGDVAEGLAKAAAYGIPGQAYNLGSGVETSIIEIADMIVELTESLSELRMLPGRDWDNSGRRFADTSKSKSELDFEARVPLRIGLERTVAWQKSNFLRIEQAISRHKHQLALASEK